MSTQVFDYVGRRVDVAVLRPVNQAVPTRTESILSLGAVGGAVCAGIQKLAQKWMVLFLTSRGSVRYFPDKGSSFPDSIANGRVRTDPELAALFAVAADEVAEQIAATETDEDPADERLASVDLLGATVNRSNLEVKLSVQINSQAGTSRQVLFPITVVP